MIRNRPFAIAGCAAILAVLFLLPATSFAQAINSTALTITPPFFDLNVNPGDSWSSAVRVVNTNSTDIQVHAEVMGFAASDDLGHGNFIPLAELADDQDALANWITVLSPSIDVPAGQAADVPFSISIPMNASPGGHYAGILIGTGAPIAQSGTSQVGVSSFVSALIFVRVSGDVIESASIQNFSTDRSYYQTPNVHFIINLQNTGNVHVRPVGQIQIYNAFGKERGSVAINATGNLGYVLPSSSREFDVAWAGQASLLDIGPYTAVVSLAYGENGTKSVSRSIEFWVLPIGQLAEVGLLVLVVALIFMFTVKRLIRKMLANEISRYGGVAPAPKFPVPGKAADAKHFDGHPKRQPSSPGSDTIDLRGGK